MRLETCTDAPEHWQVKSIESLALRVTSGGTPSRKRADFYADSEGIPWVKTQELLDRVIHDTEEHLSPTGLSESSAKLLPAGSLLVAMYAAPTAGRMAILAREMTCNQAACAIVPDASQTETRWLFYQLLANRDQLHRLANGAAQQNLSAALIRTLELPVPPIAEQRAIVGVLGALDDKIESNRRILETAKRLITAEYHCVLRSVDDEPYGVRLDVQMGAPFKGEHFSEIGHGRPLIRIRDLKTFSSQVWTTESRTDEIGIVPGDILVGMDAEFRSTIWLGDAGVLNQRMCRFVARKGVSRSFAWLAIQPELEYCERAKSGTTVIHLNKGDIDRFRVPRLSDEQHEKLSLVTEPVFDRLVVAGREISSLSGLRDALLPELLAGRLRVRDAEKVVEGAV